MNRDEGIAIRRARPQEARRQAAWIVALEPWRSLGYRTAGLGRWLARRAADGWVRLALGSGGRSRNRPVAGIIVVQPDVLLGHFIALLAVPAEQAGQGIGRALVAEAAQRTHAGSRWLYTSSDSANRVAARFYRAMGFQRVGRLPGLITPDRVEVLWRRGSNRAVSSRARLHRA